MKKILEQIYKIAGELDRRGLMRLADQLDRSAGHLCALAEADQSMIDDDQGQSVLPAPPALAANQQPAPVQSGVPAQPSVPVNPAASKRKTDPRIGNQIVKNLLGNANMSHQQMLDRLKELKITPTREKGWEGLYNEVYDKVQEEKEKAAQTGNASAGKSPMATAPAPAPTAAPLPSPPSTPKQGPLASQLLPAGKKWKTESNVPPNAWHLGTDKGGLGNLIEYYKVPGDGGSWQKPDQITYIQYVHPVGTPRPR